MISTRRCLRLPLRIVSTVLTICSTIFSGGLPASGNSARSAPTAIADVIAR
jgi:hypothetical protein